MSPPSEEGATAGIAGTTDSGDPLSLIHPPEGGRISPYALATRRKKRPRRAACKSSRSKPLTVAPEPSAPGARNGVEGRGRESPSPAL